MRNGLGLAGLVHEKVIRVEDAILEPVIHAAVQFVCAALGAHADDRTEDMAGAGIVSGLHLELDDGVGRRNEGRARVILAGVVSGVVDAVDLELRLVHACAVDGYLRRAFRGRRLHGPKRGEVDHPRH